MEMAHWNAFLFGLLPWGLSLPDWAPFILRLFVGLPFFISGGNKLFCPICHSRLVNNLTKSGIPCVSFMVWWLAFWECLAGLLLLLGLFSSAAAFILFVVCIVAFVVSWRRKLERARPVHFLDACTEIGFLFDTLLIGMLLSLMLSGPGPISLDFLLWR